VLTAIGLASGTGPDPGPILAASPSSLNFGTVQTDSDVAVTNLGTGSVTIEVSQTSEPWLTTEPLSVDPVSGLGSYRLHVDRAGMVDGTYAASATFTPTEPGIDSAVVNVVMQVSSVNIDADAGLQYVLLVDNAGGTVGAPQVLKVDAGRYPFRFTNVAPGEYRLVAGSDMDDDAILCDAGEACGAFRTLDEPETLVVSPATADSLNGLDFVSEFRAVISSPFTGPAAAGGSGGLHFQRPDEKGTP
jgi:serine protease